MSRRLKKYGSILGLRMGEEHVQESERNVTPPSNTNPDDAFTTPPQRPAEVGDATPADDVITSPVTPLRSSPKSSSLVKKIIEPFVKQSKSLVVLPETWLRQGITGSDPTLPIFDGSSMDIGDHLIDVGTDSMETAPDVRVYFWAIGFECHSPDYPDTPINLEERRLFDAKLVRTGREYLKDLQQRGIGWFMSPNRDISLKNETGSEWYRMPTTAISNDISCGIVSPLEDECSFFEDQDFHLDYAVVTNMRIPLWWVETLSEGVVPGTTGWDDAVQSAYYELNHPGYMVYKGAERERLIANIVRMAVGDAAPLDKADQVLRRDWPNVAAHEDDPDGEFIGPGYLEYSNSTVDQFLGRTK